MNIQNVGALKNQIKVSLRLSAFAIWKSFLEDVNFIEERASSKLYRTFTRNPVHNLNLDLEALKRMYNDIFRYSYGGYRQSSVAWIYKAVQLTIIVLVKAVTYLPAAIQDIYPASKLHTNF